MPTKKTDTAEGTPHTEFAYLSPRSAEWKKLETNSEEDDEKRAVKKARDNLEQVLLSSLKMEHLVVLSGSGCSLNAGGPSMGKLWKEIVGSPTNKKATKVAEETGYDLDNHNIEDFLSHIEAWLSVSENSDVKDFLDEAKNTILRLCSSFIADRPLTAHEIMLHRLSRRRSRDQRLKLFTTNYDLCFEKAAASIGAVAIDGFSFMAPRRYDPRYFDYDIVRRPRSGDHHANYLEGLFLYYKLHGSVNWKRSKDGVVEEGEPSGENACLIYPARGKYQQSYNQPYLESISQYLAAFREPNTCILIVGFGFNDDHLSEPLLSAIRSNPNLRVLVADPLLKQKSESGSLNRIQTEIFEQSSAGEDIWLINADFEQFSISIPDLKSLTPAERLWNMVQSSKTED